MLDATAKVVVGTDLCARVSSKRWLVLVIQFFVAYFYFSLPVEIDFSEMRIRIDDFEQIFVYFEIVCPFFADRALPPLSRQPTRNISVDKAFQIKRFIVRSAVLRSYWDRDFVRIEMAVQWYL